MFKGLARPCLAVTAEALSPAATRLRGCSCHLSTRSRSHPIHSTARVTVSRRPDHYARTEYYGPGGKDLRTIMTYRDYKAVREKAGSSNSSNHSLASIVTENNLPGLLTAYASLASTGRKPSRDAYMALLEAAGAYSVQRAALDQDRNNTRVQTAENTDALDPNLAKGFLPEQGMTGLGWKLAWCAWQDARAGDTDLGIEGFDLLLHAASPYPQLLPSLLHYALDTPTLAANLTSDTYNTILRRPIQNQNIDFLMLLFTEIRARGIEMPIGRAGQIIAAACEHGMVRLALDMARREEENFQYDLETQVWVDILRSSSDKYFIDGVEAAWDRVVRSKRFQPEEGLCTLVLGVAGRHQRPEIALSVMEVLGEQGITPKEYHFPPLLEALCGAGRVSDAMETLGGMRRSGFRADLAAAEPIIRALSNTTEDVDKGFYGLQALKATGKHIDTAAFNAVLKGAEMLGDANRAMVIYSQAASLEVVPNLETYHVLLSACVKAGAISQAEHLLQDMERHVDGVADGRTERSLSSSFDSTTYELLIRLYLVPENYEKAFEYLEVMKSKNIRPPLAAYESLVRKCVEEGDGRSQPLLQEMQAGGYKPTNQLVRFVRNVASRDSASAGRSLEHRSKPSNQKP